MNKLLATTGNGVFFETSIALDPVPINGIRVRSIMTGICRSDIDMMNGYFNSLPLGMQGHEGLGEVVEVGKLVYDVFVGDLVATRGEPAYADFYNVRFGEYVKVPEAHPRYIIEPVACGVNSVNQYYYHLKRKEGGRLLINGTGFLSYVAYITLKISNFNFDIDVIGNHHHDLFGSDHKNTYDGEYDVIMDFKGNDLYAIATNGILVNAVSKVTTKQIEDHLLWNCVTTIRPSPRSKTFFQSMEYAVKWIKEGRLNVDRFWTQSYNRNTEWQQAFQDGANRPTNYGRGYIVWP